MGYAQENSSFSAHDRATALMNSEHLGLPSQELSLNDPAKIPAWIGEDPKPHCEVDGFWGRDNHFSLRSWPFVAHSSSSGGPYTFEYIYTINRTQWAIKKKKRMQSWEEAEDRGRIREKLR